jgi:hypothetical protein
MTKSSLIPLLIFFILKITTCIPLTLKDSDTIKLPAPEKEGGMPLYEALNKRKSSRDFNPLLQVNSKIISQALWSCYGINRDNGLRTTPSAKAWFPLDTYVFLKEGVFKYNPKPHTLTRILTGDYRKMTGTQSFVSKARVNFVFIADFKKKSPMDGDDAHKLRSIYLDTGHCAMALSLFASANNMKGVDRAMVEAQPILDLLKLKKDDYIFTLAFSLGY